MTTTDPCGAHRPFRVGIMGASLRTGNRGVSALGASLARLMWQARPDASITLLIGQRDTAGTDLVADGTPRTVATVNYRLSPRAPLREQLWWIVLLSWLYRFAPSAARDRITRSTPWIRAVAGADLVGDIRGGDSFSDIYGARMFLRGCLPVLSVIWIRGGLHLFPQTYGPFRSRAARGMARYILRHAESIWCRDRASLHEVARITGGRRSGTLCPDVAFALEARRPDPFVLEPPRPAGDTSTLIGVNVSGLMYYGGYTRANMFGLTLEYPAFVERLVAQFLSQPGTRVVLVPHTFAPEGSVESDPAASRAVIAALDPSLRDRVHLVTQECDQHEIKWVIGQCDFFVGSRMHACIAALSQGIPCAAVAYSRKFAGVFDVVGAAEWVVDGRSLRLEQALERVTSLYGSRRVGRASLSQTLPATRTALTAAFKHVVGLRLDAP